MKGPREPLPPSTMPPRPGEQKRHPRGKRSYAINAGTLRQGCVHRDQAVHQWEPQSLSCCWLLHTLDGGVPHPQPGSKYHRKGTREGVLSTLLSTWTVALGPGETVWSRSFEGSLQTLGGAENPDNTIPSTAWETGMWTLCFTINPAWKPGTWILCFAINPAWDRVSGYCVCHEPSMEPGRWTLCFAINPAWVFVKTYHRVREHSICRDDAKTKWRPYTSSFTKYRLWTSIKSKPAFRSHSRLIIEIIKLQESGKNLVEVASRRKVKNLKGQNFGLLLLYIFFNKATEVSVGAMVLIFTRMILILKRRVPFPTFVTIVLHMVTAAFPALYGYCLNQEYSLTS